MPGVRCELVKTVDPLVGNRTGVVDSLGTTTYVYDTLDRLVSVTDPFSQQVQYTYDPNGNRASLVYPDGRRTAYSYDALNRLTSVADWHGGTDNYTYDLVGNLLTVSYANGTSRQVSYDPANRPLSVADHDAAKQLSAAFTYSYDATGNTLSAVEQFRRSARYNAWLPVRRPAAHSELRSVGF